MPRRVVHASARDRAARRARAKGVDPRERLAQLVGGADDPDEVLHRVGELGVQRVRVLAAAPLEWREDLLRSAAHLLLVEQRHAREALRVLGRIEARAAAEHEQVGERVATEAVRAVHPGGDLARGEEPGHGRLRRVGVDADAAHDVVQRRPDLHRLLGDVDARELHELVVHRWQPPLDVFGAPARGNVEEHAAVRTAASGLHFGIDRACHLIAWQ